MSNACWRREFLSLGERMSREGGTGEGVESREDVGTTRVSDLQEEYHRARRKNPPIFRPTGSSFMRKAGLEPAWIAPLPPQDSVSANSTTSAITFVVETRGISTYKTESVIASPASGRRDLASNFHTKRDCDVAS